MQFVARNIAKIELNFTSATVAGHVARKVTQIWYNNTIRRDKLDRARCNKQIWQDKLNSATQIRATATDILARELAKLRTRFGEI